MKSLVKIQCLLAVTFALLGCSQQNKGKPNACVDSITIAISPYLSDRDQTVTALSTWLMHQGNCQVRIFDAWQGTQITEFVVPTVEYFKEAAVAQKIGAPFQKWLLWSREPVTDAKLSGSGTVAINKLLDRLVQGNSAPTQLLIIGSPIARSPAEPDYDFAEPNLRYPSTAHFKSAESLFSCVGKERSMIGARVYFLFPKVNTSNWPATYEAELHRFYGTMLANRSANLVAFTPDLDAGLRLINQAAVIPFNDFKLGFDSDRICMIDARSNKPEVPRTVISTTPNRSINLISTGAIASVMPSSNSSAIEVKPVVLAAATMSPSATSFPVPTKLPASPTVEPVPLRHSSLPSGTGPVAHDGATNKTRTVYSKPGVTIEMRFKSDSADADLYVRPHSDAVEISYTRPSTMLGAYRYEFDFQSGEHVKSIYLPAGCDPAKAEAWVNYSKGVGRLAGKLQWLSRDTQREMPFSFLPANGSDESLRWESRRKRSEYWLRLNLRDLLSDDTSKSLSEASPQPSRAATGSGQSQTDLNSTK